MCSYIYLADTKESVWKKAGLFGVFAWFWRNAFDAADFGCPSVLIETTVCLR